MIQELLEIWWHGIIATYLVGMAAFSMPSYTVTTKDLRIVFLVLIWPILVIVVVISSITERLKK